MSDLSMKVCEWMSMGKVGVSSATMASIALGLKKPVYGTHFGYPYDPADLNRCRILVKHIPEIRDSFKKIGRRVPGFKPILDNWDELIALLDEEMQKNTGSAPRTYARMKELLGRHA